MENTTSRVNVAPTPLYKPAMPFSRYNCKANCREVRDCAESKQLKMVFCFVKDFG